jgi:hypothetical protein
VHDPVGPLYPGPASPRPYAPTSTTDTRGRAMTPQEHYDEAVRLIAEAARIPANNDVSNPAAALVLAEAQVHATLALYQPAEATARAMSKGHECLACSHSTIVHRAHGCDATGCGCRAPFGRIMPGDPTS